MVIKPSIFEILLGGYILYRIWHYMIIEQINYYKMQKQKPSKVKNDIKARLQKANRKYYKQFNQ